MCEICGKSPCHPRCPNADEPEAIYTCVKCGGDILPGEEYMDYPYGEICGKCLDNMDVSDWTDLIGGIITTAKEEDYYG